MKILFLFHIHIHIHNIIYLIHTHTHTHTQSYLLPSDIIPITDSDTWLAVKKKIKSLPPPYFAYQTHHPTGTSPTTINPVSPVSPVSSLPSLPVAGTENINIQLNSSYSIREMDNSNICAKRRLLLAVVPSPYSSTVDTSAQWLIKREQLGGGNVDGKDVAVSRGESIFGGRGNITSYTPLWGNICNDTTTTGGLFNHHHIFSVTASSPSGPISNLAANKLQGAFSGAPCPASISTAASLVRQHSRPDGTVDREGILRIFASLGVTDAMAVEHSLQLFDTAMDSKMDMRELQVGLAVLLTGHTHANTHTNLEDLLSLAFSAFDTDNNGYIDRTELSNLVKYSLAVRGCRCQPQELQKIVDETMRQVDVGGHVGLPPACMSFIQFKNAVFKGLLPANPFWKTPGF
eukprot:GHVR01192528.1.p1 GENE.GHVR01192528.1~~GHVR01192528.1.p1  ORF type:complete len:404 (+),score=132.20 GHVR01192528.1:578-1789(+)